MRKLKVLMILVSFLFVGCYRDYNSEQHISQTTHEKVRRDNEVTTDEKVLPKKTIKESTRGSIIVAFPGTENLNFRHSGIYNAVNIASENVQCSASFFSIDSCEVAYDWLIEQQRKKEAKERKIIIIGYGFGGSIAGDFAQKVLRESTRHKIVLLVTVDAIKSSTLSFTTSATANIITFDSKIAGKDNSFVSFTDTPKPDGKRLLCHINYYQNNSRLMRGSRIETATQNYLIERSGTRVVDHGNLDNYVERLLAADIKRNMQK